MKSQSPSKPVSRPLDRRGARPAEDEGSQRVLTCLDDRVQADSVVKKPVKRRTERLGKIYWCPSLTGAPPVRRQSEGGALGPGRSHAAAIRACGRLRDMGLAPFETGLFDLDIRGIPLETSVVCASCGPKCLPPDRKRLYAVTAAPSWSVCRCALCVGAEVTCMKWPYLPGPCCRISEKGSEGNPARECGVRVTVHSSLDEEKHASPFIQDVFCEP